MPGEKLKALYKQCAEYFDALYTPEQRIYVFGDGDPQADIVLVGEAPGEQETLLQKPFVGKAGKNLDDFLELTNLKRPQLFITNVVKFRPVKVSEKGRASNRAPTREEIELWTPWLEREIALVRPRFIITLGNVPLHALTGQKTPIGQAHGNLWPGDILGAKLFALYHPASVIYNRSLGDTYIEDVRAFGRLYGTLGARDDS